MADLVRGITRATADLRTAILAAMLNQGPMRTGQILDVLYPDEPHSWHYAKVYANLRTLVHHGVILRTTTQGGGPRFMRPYDLPDLSDPEDVEAWLAG